MRARVCIIIRIQPLGADRGVAGKEEQIDPEQAALAGRFRAERERLDMSTADVAHFCGVSVSSVFNWEAGRARIPLSAIANLWEFGFDPENLVSDAVETVDVPFWPTGRIPKAEVPKHLIHRHLLTGYATFVYHNQAEAAGIAAPGDLLVMGAMPERDPVSLEEESRIMLLDPSGGKGGEFLCKVSRSRPRKVRLELEEEWGFANTAELLRHCEVRGWLAFRLGYHRPFDPSRETHTDRMCSFLKRFG